jgi:hypothetical protein
MDCRVCWGTGWRAVKRPEPVRYDGVPFSVTTMFSECECKKQETTLPKDYNPYEFLHTNSRHTRYVTGDPELCLLRPISSLTSGK